ncbi:NAD(P)-binding protein [Pontivivens insulae]|uniref:Amine oxidase domain-containing protein n=1 Tax=Pontivivens insulae TaxID=1639689 RepID=A0A2R8A833_9RHOB|nr:NAD(P)-binding protein [Pontivivens insulae]RED18282.1 protoporphyrinogen oxidase [Pontivivens insulae]SPF28180.1 hypothetical protein POI8812_00478 [Pontivivens insulae]
MPDMNGKHIAIVGGGYLGTMAALYASLNPDIHVTLIEKQDKLCGLYNSAHSKDGYHFDFGSRAILATRIQELDDLILSLLPDTEYTKSTDTLLEYSYQNGNICEYSNCLDARLLPKEVFEAGKAEMLALEPPIDAPRNLREFCLGHFGKIYTHSLVEPVIAKLTNAPLEGLSADTLSLYSIARIIIADSHEAKALKSHSKFNDDRIAFARCDDNISNLIKIYPKRAGLADYANRLETYLRTRTNVTLCMDSSVSSFEYDNGRIIAAHLDASQKIHADQYFWTIPAIFLAKIIGTDTSDLSPPNYRHTVLSHYLFSGELQTSGYFHYNYDSNHKYYRATLYENFCERPGPWSSMTVESVTDDIKPDLEKLENQFFEEIKAVGLISEDSKIHDATTRLHRGAWPSFTNEFLNNADQLNSRVGDQLENLHLVGKSSGKHHSVALLQHFIASLKANT